MYFAAKINGGLLTVRARLGDLALGTFKLYRATTAGDLVVIATDLDPKPDEARFDLSEAMLAQQLWASLSLRLGIRGLNHTGSSFTVELQVSQGEPLIATDADGAALKDQGGGWYDLGMYASYADHYPRFAVFFR